MAFTVLTEGGNPVIEHTGTDANIAGLDGLQGVTRNGNVYNVGAPVVEFRISGDLTIADFENLQIDDAVRFSRPNGGVLTMKPFSKIEILGLGRGADLVNNTFRGGFTFNAELLELGDGRIQTPVFREAPNGRSDCFSCYSPDFDSGLNGGVTFNIQGLTLIYTPVTSAKIYATASSQLDNIHLKRVGGNFVELQVGFNNGAETKSFDKLIFDNVDQLSTRGGATQVGSVFLLTTPKYLFPNDFSISLVNLRSDVEYIELRDIQSIGVGQWDGTITNIFRGIRTTNTQKRTYLAGSTPVSNIKTVYTPANGIGTEITDISAVDGVTEQVLTYGESVPRGDFFTGVIPQETWTIVAVGYNQRLASSSFRLLDNETPLTSDEGLQVVNAPVNELDKSLVDAYTDIDTSNKLHDRTVSFVVDNPVGLNNYLIEQVGDVIDLKQFSLVIEQNIPTYNFDGSTISINASTFTGSFIGSSAVTLEDGVTLNGGATNDVILKGTSTITNGSYGKVILDTTFVGTQITFTDVNITELENLTGNNIEITLVNSTIDTLTQTNGALSIPQILNITDFQGENTKCIVWDASDVQKENAIYPYADSLVHSVNVTGISRVRITIDKPAFYAKTFELDITGDAIINESVILDPAPNVDVSVDITDLINATTTEIIEDGIATFDLFVATVNQDIENITASQWRRYHDFFTETENGLKILGLFNLSGNEVYNTTLAGVNVLMPSLQIIPSGLSKVSTQAFNDISVAQAMIPAYEYLPRNTQNVKVEDSIVNPLVDYEFLEKLIIDNSGGVSLEDIEQSTVLAKEASTEALNTLIQAIPTTDSVADLTPVLDAINNLNNINAVDIRTELQTELARIDANVSSVAYDDSVIFNLVDALPTLAEMETSQILTAIADVTGLSTHNVNEVVTALQNVSNDFKTDLTPIVDSQQVINDGVKKSSLGIPHNTDI